MTQSTAATASTYETPARAMSASVRTSSPPTDPLCESKPLSSALPAERRGRAGSCCCFCCSCCCARCSTNWRAITPTSSTTQSGGSVQRSGESGKLCLHVALMSRIKREAETAREIFRHTEERQRRQHEPSKQLNKHSVPHPPNDNSTIFFAESRPNRARVSAPESVLVRETHGMARCRWKHSPAEPNGRLR